MTKTERDKIAAARAAIRSGQRPVTWRKAPSGGARVFGIRVSDNGAVSVRLLDGKWRPAELADLQVGYGYDAL